MRGRGGRRGDEPPASGASGLGQEADPESVARAIALRLLASSARSRGQLAEAMQRKDVPDDVAERVLDRFTEVGLIDDAEYARMLVRTRHAERGLSRRAIGVELRRRGIQDDVATEALGEVDDDDEEQAARALVRRRLASTAGLEPQVRARRTFAALGRRGYPAALVSRLVREVLAEEGAAVDDLADGVAEGD
jgi:regulatory protein